MFRNDCYDRQNEVNNNFYAEDMNIDYDVEMNNMSTQMLPAQNMTTQPIIEPMQERVVNRTIVHEVPHVCPIQTRIVNHHVFKHTYQPAYSCCEENVCSEVQCGSCCCFR